MSTINTWTDDVFASFPGNLDDDYNDSKAMQYLEDHVSEWVEIEMFEYYDGIQVVVTDDDTHGQRALREESKQGPNDKHVLINRFCMDELMEVVYRMNNLKVLYFKTQFGCDFQRPYFVRPLPKSVKHVTLQDSKYGTVSSLKDVSFLTLLVHDVEEDIDMSDGEELKKLVCLEEHGVKITVEMLLAETEEDFTDNFKSVDVLQADLSGEDGSFENQFYISHPTKQETEEYDFEEETEEVESDFEEETEEEESDFEEETEEAEDIN